MTDSAVNLWRPIEPSRPLTFVHIPKTAGTSFRLYLENQYGLAKTCPAVDWAELFQFRDRLDQFSLIRGHFGANVRELAKANAASATILRHPIERTISALKHLLRDPKFNPPAYAMAQGQTLKQILRNEPLMLRFANIQAAILAATQPAVEVLKAIENQQGDKSSVDIGLPSSPDLALAKQQLESFDFVGVVEDIDGFMRDISEGLLFQPASEFPLANYAPKEQKAEKDFDAEDIEILRRYNSIDIPLYDFARDLIIQRRSAAQLKRLLAEKHYVVPSGSFSIQMDGIFPGAGWHGSEREDGIIWRWTGPGTAFTLELLLDQTVDYQLKIQFGCPHRPFDDKKVRVLLNAHPVEFVIEKRGAEYEFKIPIAKENTAKYGGACAVVFDIDAVLSLPTDLRQLGIVVRSIIFDVVQNADNTAPV